MIRRQALAGPSPAASITIELDKIAPASGNPQVK
jgi:hypothetical protein